MTMNWIPIKLRPLTYEEKQQWPDQEEIFDCPLPEDGQDVLVTTKYGHVVFDTFCSDDKGFYFEYYCQADDLIAWMPLPAPYTKPKENE